MKAHNPLCGKLKKPKSVFVFYATTTQKKQQQNGKSLYIIHVTYRSSRTLFSAQTINYKYKKIN